MSTPQPKVNRLPLWIRVLLFAVLILITGAAFYFNFSRFTETLKSDADVAPVEDSEHPPE